MKGFFVTGTDTGVGKTAVVAAVAHALTKRGIDVGVMKPVQSGSDNDAAFLMKAAGSTDAPSLVCPFAFAAPVAPTLAARLEERSIDWERIMEAFHTLASRHEAMVIEGAGGIMVPLREEGTKSLFVSDLAAAMGLPLIIVARPGLGTVNHTLLTVEHARQKGLVIAGVVINAYPKNPGLSEKDNPAMIGALAGGIPVMTLPHVDPGTDEGLLGLADALESGELLTLFPS